ncbi:MAG: FtsL-like putative cell division protein [Bacteroidales bacterium]|nr:FtsL-like putative cell division protein [Bacteroidales bacterium]MDT8432503.1 FtsL-like putative cell division protein [Bacteroidales bacterium]
MSRERKNIEFEEVREEKGQQFSFRSLIDGNVLTQRAVIRQAPFMALLVLLALIMIANRNHAEKLVIRSNALQTEVKELRSQAITTSSELMTVSRQSRVEQLVREKELGLTENKEPLKKLVIEKK